MQFRIHRTDNTIIAELQGNGVLLKSAADARDLWFQAYRERADWMAIHESNIAPDFFKLRTGLAGEILQKLVNYRAHWAIVGDISRYLEKSESLRALVRESNRGKDVRFVQAIEDLIEALK